MKKQNHPTLADVAVWVLKRVGNPMHYLDLWNAIAEKGLYDSKGRTPQLTLNAVVGTEIKNRARKSRFKRVGRGKIALN